MVAKLVGAAVVVFVIFYILTAPDQAHHITVGAGHLIADVAKGIRDFVNDFA